jgi:hypothetical protein
LQRHPDTVAHQARPNDERRDDVLVGTLDGHPPWPRQYDLAHDSLPGSHQQQLNVPDPAPGDSGVGSVHA